LSSSKIKNKEGKPEYQIIISFCKPAIAQKEQSMQANINCI